MRLLDLRQPVLLHRLPQRLLHRRTSIHVPLNKPNGQLPTLLHRPVSTEPHMPRPGPGHHRAARDDAFVAGQGYQ
ncbi:hypothetical protein M3J09_005697 [Ascochyta lentis]